MGTLVPGCFVPFQQPFPDMNRSIVAFGFGDPQVEVIVLADASEIVLTVPHGTDVTALVPQIRYQGASVEPAAGVPQDFTNPVIYRVTAQTGAVRSYRVTVIVERSAPPVGVTVTTEVNVTLSGSSAMNSGSTMTVTATPSVMVDSYAWYLDGSLQSGQTGASITVGTGLTPGPHSLAVVVSKDGVLFSQTFYFVVLVSSSLASSSKESS